MNFSEWQQIATVAQVGDVEAVKPLQDNNHHQCWQLTTDKNHYFVKTTLKRYAPMVITEAHSLAVLNQTQTLRCPKVISQGETSTAAWLILEWMPLKNTGDQALLGKQLAALHRHNATQFGWSETNFIEQGIQYNHSLDEWPSFYRAQRLMPQLRRAKEQGLAQGMVVTIETLIDRIDDFFCTYTPEPSLLHGNFSNSNVAFLEDGSPIIINPSCVYGDREMDIAMSQLSGCFNSEFYVSYQDAYPLMQGNEIRKPLYQLYYLLNKFNCYGSDYALKIKVLLNDF